MLRRGNHLKHQLGAVRALSRISHALSRVSRRRLQWEVTSTQTNSLLNALHTAWAPCAVSGDFVQDFHRRLFKPDHLSSRLGKLDIQELRGIALAKQHDNTADRFEIAYTDPGIFKYRTLLHLTHTCHYHKLMPWLRHELRPVKLLVDGIGDRTVSSTKKDADFVGTLLVNLNSDYIGGEVTVTYDNNASIFAKKKAWVAIHKDCDYSLGPVTAGSRVDMLFDIHTYEPVEGFDAPQYGSVSDPTISCITMDAKKQEQIVNAAHSELMQNDTIVISLAQQYSTPSVLPGSLLGGDQAVYDILNAHFIVSFEPIQIKGTLDPLGRPLKVTDAKLVNNIASGLGKIKLVIPNKLSPSNLVASANAPPVKQVYNATGLVVRKRP